MRGLVLAGRSSCVVATLLFVASPLTAQCGEGDSKFIASTVFESRLFEFRNWVSTPPACLWEDAKQACEALGGHLVTVLSEEENEVVSSLLDQAAAKGKCPVHIVVWIGLTDEGIEGTFEWVTGEPFSYSNWAPGEPNDIGDEQNWVHVYCPEAQNGEYMWSDLHNLPGQAFICEYDPMQVGGSVTGFTPIQIACTNKTTGQGIVIKTSARSWDCEAAGLVVNPGDIVRLTVSGVTD